jgi:hypothetical protein
MELVTLLSCRCSIPYKQPKLDRLVVRSELLTPATHRATNDNGCFGIDYGHPCLKSPWMALGSMLLMDKLEKAQPHRDLLSLSSRRVQHSSGLSRSRFSNGDVQLSWDLTHVQPTGPKPR